MLIYLAKNKTNGKYYVGKTKGSLSNRWQVHLWDAKKGSKVTFHKAIRKYGESSFELEILSTCSSLEEMNNLEVLWIITLASCDRQIGYNMGFGTAGGYGDKPLEERRKIAKKISESLTGKPQPRTPARIAYGQRRRGQSNTAWKGKTIEQVLGPEKAAIARRKQSEAKKGSHPLVTIEGKKNRVAAMRTDAYRIGAGERAKLRWSSKEYKESTAKSIKLSLAKPESKKKMAEAQKKANERPEVRQHRSDAMQSWWDKRKKKTQCC